MNSLSKYFGIFFALVLGLTSISKEYHEVVLPVAVQEKADFPASSQVLAKQLNDIFCVQQQTGQLVSTSNSYPVPDSKINSYNLLKGSCSLEQRIGSLSTTYLSFSRRIFPSYAATAIIFPFHYYW